MARRFSCICFLLLASGLAAQAIENTATTTYQETAATNTNIANWASGWPQPAQQPKGTTYTTGWNYVGAIGTESGVYLGYGWVLTCAHVGAGNFVLNGVTYTMVANSTHSFYNGATPYDFLLFQISNPPNLPALTLRHSDPVAGTTPFALIGYGDPTNVESWGLDTVTDVNQATDLKSGFVTNDFRAYGANGASYQNISNDSGGGDFMYNATTKQWELGGLNEANNSDNGSTPTVSFFVQLNTYAAQIEAVYLPPSATSADTPTLPSWALAVMGGLLFVVAIPAVASERK